MRRSKLIPSMFERRLLLLAVVFAIVTLGLSTQLLRLSVVHGETNLAEAEARMRQKSYLPQPRAEILDRRGRILARDTASYDVAVEYEVITGDWARQQAEKLARKQIGRAAWSELRPREREIEVRQRLGEFDERTQDLWDAIRTLGGLSEEELDERRDAIKRQVETLVTLVWNRQMDQSVNEGDEDSEARRDKPKIREEEEAHVILPRVSDEVALEFQLLARRWPGMLEVQDSTRREYPWQAQTVELDRSALPGPLRSSAPIQITVEGVADHIIGRTREAWAEDLKRRPLVNSATGKVDLGGYALGDAVGSRGFEGVFEDQLRGMRGMVEQRLDSGVEHRIERTPGRPLQTTLDISLQARVQAILDPAFGLTRVHQWQAGWGEDGPKPMLLPPGTPLNSAAVVLDVESGQILAMVSMPTMAMGQKMNESQRATDNPWVNRPVEAIYPPGSIIKPLVLCAAVSEGVQSLDGRVECNGHFFPDLKDAARCWIYRPPYFPTHGSLDCVEALARSCNIYFYTLASRLGMNRLSQWYRAFGLGTALDVGLLNQDESSQAARWIGESAGSVPDASVFDKTESMAFETISIGIGQGKVTWTPVQAANAYAILARHGVMRDATLIVDESRVRHVPQRPDLKLSDALVAHALEGLRESVEEPFGTGNHITYEDGRTEPIINATGVTVWAKTGTAEAPPTRVDADGDGIAETKLIDPLHAWVVGLVGDSRTRQPRFAIAVIVELGGSGGRTAGPVANQIIHALQDEGYFSSDSPGNGGSS